MDISEVRILHVSKYYFPFRGGTEQVARDTVKALLGTGARQKVICFQDGRQDQVDFVDGVEIIRAGVECTLASQGLSLSYARLLRQTMDNFRPNLILLHYPNPFVTHLLLKYKNRDFKLLVYWHLDITKQKLLKHFFYKQNLDLIRRADRILGATPKHVDESAFTNEFGSKRCVLPYMIDESGLVLSQDEIAMAGKIKARYPGRVLGFFIGRHVPYKGLTYLIRASKELGDEQLHFLIAGSGELTGRLKQEAQGDSKIEFLGQISDSERRAYLSASDIICFPSVTRNEGFGLALAEGMYFGHPAVTFTIPGSGVNYVNMDRVTGIECPNGDYLAYAKAIKKLSDDEALRRQYGAAARRRVEENFTSLRFKQNWLDLIEGL